MFFQATNKGENEWYLYLLGVIAVFIGYLLGQIPLISIAYFITSNNPEYGTEVLDKFISSPDFTLLGLSSNIGFIIVLLLFIMAFFALVLVMKFLHKRNFLSLVSFKERLDFNKIFFGFIIWFLLGSLGELFTYYVNPSNYTFSFDFLNFLGLFLIGIFILPIQTSFEELFFRGYIMQGLGLLFKYKWVAILGSALFFGLVHGSNPEVGKYGLWVMMTYYIYAGLFFGLITVMDESLELALGVHFATNLFGTLILGYESSAIQTNTLFKTTDMDAEVMLMFLFLFSIIFYIICSKKYNWPKIITIFTPINYNTNNIDDNIIQDNLLS